MQIMFRNNITVEAEVALTPESKKTGLMFRNSLDKQAGMLFVYDQQPAAIWMKNTYIPLDVLFCRATKDGGQVVKIAYGEPLSEKTIMCDERVDYVIELNKGFCDENKIGVGEYFSINSSTDIKEQLSKVANMLECNGLFEEANVVDKLLENKKIISRKLL